MNKLLIFTLFLPALAFGAPTTKKAVKTPPKALLSTTVRLSTPYLQSYPKSSISLRTEPKTLNEGKKIIQKECIKNTLECDIFMDTQNHKLLNITVNGESKNIKKLINWVKKNSKTYTENKPSKK